MSILKKNRLCVIFYIIAIALLYVCVQKFVNNCRTNFCQKIEFCYRGDTALSVHPFYSSSRHSYVVVLPSFWDPNNIVIYNDGDIVECNKENDSTFAIGGGILCLYTKQDCMFINTQSGTMEIIDGSIDKSKKETGNITILRKNGEVDYKGDYKHIHGRGHGTWRQHIKKPYNLNMGKKVNLLGMQKGKKYCLLSNNMDRTNAKNFIAYRLAKDMKMPCSIDERFVSLFLNGHYNGLYLLTNDINVTSNRKDKHRIYQIEYNEESFRIKYPKKGLSIRDEKFLQSYYRDMLNALKATDSAENRFMLYLHVHSFAQYYLLQELLFNYDWGNFYMSINNVDKKFRALTIWDLDQSMGMQHENDNVIENSSRLYSFRLGRWYENEKKNSMFGLLCKKVAFLDSIRTIFADSLSPICRQFLDGNGFRNMKEMLLYENSLDDARWPSDNNGSEIDDVKTFLLQRLAFLEQEMWQRNTDVQMVKMVCYQPRKGLNRVYEVPVRKDSFFIPPVSHLISFCGWKNNIGENLSRGFRVESDTTIYAEWWDLPNWFKIDRNTVKIFSDMFD